METKRDTRHVDQSIYHFFWLVKLFMLELKRLLEQIIFSRAI